MYELHNFYNIQILEKLIVYLNANFGFVYIKLSDIKIKIRQLERFISLKI